MYFNGNEDKLLSPLHSAAPLSSQHPSITENDILRYHELLQTILIDKSSPMDANSSFNIQSLEVNSGRTVGGIPGREIHSLESAFATNSLPVDFDFASIKVIPTFRKSEPELRDIVSRLLCPPPNAFVYSVLSINWVVGVIGYNNFEYRREDARFILKQDSSIRKYGRELGIPASYHEWLCGDSPDQSATEQGMILVAEFFETEL
ncbi:hypothetical protein BU24DRAFT_411340 [Aaosphaeria arxii CBS 175.79]|uniref:Uncharacterized protein n=1 Tax=Aaosphaeria arxii CBS 175.79 TaxID=1450172 RepID=A0A6A5XLD1_9PLEO|nr:uncharacterized protein BU24DRAFT_411340 [Aaosphaeria arxii CBS 175.79]KAF2013617.1 hypothetical protein BU24DRAFT_411340 [Aaosphaeria arxii CBS 175.79]